MKNLLSLTLGLLMLSGLNAQTSNETLMTIGGREISSEEFIRVYTKNNSITPTIEKKSVDEYIDLFVNYKLKVIEAENLGYDTIPAFIDEFSGYREQLAKPHLQNDKIQEELVREAYNRKLEEVNVSHILILCDENASPEDSLIAFEKISEIRARVAGGEPFEEVAKATSDDPSVKDNNGELGWFSVFQMVYPFESAAYNTPVGKISQPFRTSYGYHILKLNDRRKSQGSVDVAHLMIRIPSEGTEPEITAADKRAEEAYTALLNGMPWNEAVQTYSEHPRTKMNNGQLGWLESGQAPEEFMNACYAADTGTFTRPIKIQQGYHIAFINNKRPIESYEELKEKISKRVNNDGARRNALQESLNDSIKKQYGFSYNHENLLELLPKMDSGIFVGEWNPDNLSDMQKVVFTIGSEPKQEFTQFQIANLFNNEYSIKGQESLHHFLLRVIDDFITQELTEYAIEQLPKINADYKYLLQEYHDGILLFNLTNDEVWNKAQQDTTGLEAFYKKTDKHMWNERLKVNIYEYTDNSFTASLPALIKKQLKKKKDFNTLLEKLCPNDSVPCVQLSSKTFEKGEDTFAEKLTWEKGSTLVENGESSTFLYYVTDVLPTQPKKLNEARGLYIADYQTQLEKNWIEALKSKYTIEINTEVLNNLKENLNE